MQDNSLYVPLTSLWEVYTDKDAFSPVPPPLGQITFISYFLRNGYAYFYKDTQRSVAKPVYIITGSPPNYAFIEYGQLIQTGINTSAWKVPLNSQGAFDKIIYAYPYDENGNVELYYVEYYNALDVQQTEKSREGVPYISDNGGNTPSTSTTSIINYIPNGQFLIHNNIPPANGNQEGQITQSSTPIAAGNWTFERDETTSSIDIIRFERLGSSSNDPSNSPRYILTASCSQEDLGSGRKDICNTFNDVNKFSSNTQKYTYYFEAVSNTGSNVNVDLIYIKNYGTNGSDPDIVSVMKFTITPTWGRYLVSFTFGSNDGKSLGNLNDDNLQLFIRCPLSTIYSLSFCNIWLVSGEYTLSSFPIAFETNKEYIYRSIFSDYVPDPNGNDIGLPLILNKNGLVPDYSNIGHIYTSSKQTPELGELMADGSYYETDSYSDDGIPYSRLQKKLYIDDPVNNFSYPVFGTGIDNFTIQSFTPDFTKLIISNNEKGVVAQVSDGTIPTNFTFQRITSGQNLTKFRSYFLNEPSAVYIQANSVFPVLNSFNAQTSGFNFIEQYVKSNTYSSNVERESTNYLVKLFPFFQNINNLAGKYFTFWDNLVEYYVWFTVDGIGTRPTIPLTANEIKIQLLSTFTEKDVGMAIAFGCSSFESTFISILQGSSITAGSYFKVSTVVNDFYFYYVVDSVGADPNLANSIGIKVEIASSDSANTVAYKTMKAGNSKYYAVPDLRGKFVKVYNNANPSMDLSQVDRYVSNHIKNGLLLGSEQFSGNRNHTHNRFNRQYNIVAGNPADVGVFISDTSNNIIPPVVSSGQIDSRPDNIYLNAFIKY